MSPRVFEQLINFFFLLVPYVASLTLAKLDQGINKFYFIKMAIEQFICLY